MELYREDILEHYKNPQNKGAISNPTHSLHESNPLCGDVVDITILVEEGVVKDAKFEGKGCAISIASADMFLENIIGKKLEDIKKITQESVIESVNPNLTLSRIKCATLAYNAIMKQL